MPSSYPKCIATCLILGTVAFTSTVTLAGESRWRASASEKSACMPDARRLCRDAMPNLRKVVTCFLGQRAKLSHGCRAVLASYGL